MKLIIENILWDSRWMIKTSFVERIFGIKIPRTVRSWNRMGVNHPKYLTKHHKWRLGISLKLNESEKKLKVYLFAKYVKLRMMWALRFHYYKYTNRDAMLYVTITKKLYSIREHIEVIKKWKQQ